MNSSKLLFSLQAPLHSLAARALQNIPLLCQGELKSQQGVRAFLGLTTCQMRIFLLWRDQLTWWSQHPSSVAHILGLAHRQRDQLWASGCLQVPVLHGAYNATWACIVPETTSVAVFVPPPGTGFRSEIISLKIVKCAVLQRALFANWADLCDKNLFFIRNSLVNIAK